MSARAAFVFCAAAARFCTKTSIASASSSGESPAATFPVLSDNASPALPLNVPITGTPQCERFQDHVGCAFAVAVRRFAAGNNQRVAGAKKCAHRVTRILCACEHDAAFVPRAAFKFFSQRSIAGNVRW